MSLERTSRYMSLILRHKPEVIGIQLDEHGWANVEELIAGIAKTQEFNRDILELIVRTDEKQRYSFNEDGTLIRANQGHSIPVDVELEAWYRREVCRFDRSAGTEPENKTVCSSVQGQGDGEKGGTASRKTGSLSGKSRGNV